MKIKMLGTFLLYAAVFLFGFAAVAKDPDSIAGWKPTADLSEKAAIDLYFAGVKQELFTESETDTCTAEEVWGLEREKDLTPSDPARGQILAITGYAKAYRLACEGFQTYDCRVVLQRLTPQSSWAVEYTECEPTGSGSDPD